MWIIIERLFARNNKSYGQKNYLIEGIVWLIINITFFSSYFFLNVCIYFFNFSFNKTFTIMFKRNIYLTIHICISGLRGCGSGLIIWLYIYWKSNNISYITTILIIILNNLREKSAILIRPNLDSRCSQIRIRFFFSREEFGSVQFGPGSATLVGLYINIWIFPLTICVAVCIWEW